MYQNEDEIENKKEDTYTQETKEEKTTQDDIKQQRHYTRTKFFLQLKATNHKNLGKTKITYLK